VLWPNLTQKIFLLTITAILIIPGVIFPSSTTTTSEVSEGGTDWQYPSTRAENPTNLTVTYNETHLFFYVDVGNDTSVWNDNTDSLAIYIDGDADGGLKDFGTPRDQVKDFGMLAFASWDFAPYEVDRFGYLLKDTGNEDRDEDSRLDNLMIDQIENNETFNFTYVPGVRDNHKIFEVEINASYFGISLSPTTVFNLFVRVTDINEMSGDKYTSGALYGSSKFPDDLDWYLVDLSNPGGQELVVTDVTGQEPVINGTAMPGEWPAQVMDISEKDTIPSQEDSYVEYPDHSNNIMADGTSVGKIVLMVKDNDEVYSVDSVMGNFTSIDMALPVEFKDDGTNGDEVSGDHNYTAEFIVPLGTEPGMYPVMMHIFDIWGNHFTFTMIRDILIWVIDMNTAPRINDSAPVLITLYEDSNATYLDLNDVFYDLEGDDMDFRVADPNGSWGLKFESNNLTGSFIKNMSFRITPKTNTYLSEGVFESLTFKATDIIGSITYTINFSIKSVNDPPEIVYFLNGITALEDTEHTITIRAIDSNDLVDTLDLTTDFAEILPDLVVEESTSKDDSNLYTFVFTFTPTNEMVGDYSVNISISDDDAASSPSIPVILEKNFTLKITNMNDDPSYSSFVMEGGKEIAGDEPVEFDIDEDESVVVIITATDPDFIHGEEALSFSLTDYDPDRISIEKINDSAARVRYSPIQDYNGEETVKLSLTDGEVTIPKMITFNALPVNDEPIIKHWEVWIESEDEDEQTPEIENFEYRFYVRHRTLKNMVKENETRDVDSDDVKFAWAVYLKNSPPFAEGAEPNVIWNQQSRNGTDYPQYTFTAEGEYTVLLMIRDHNGKDFNGSFQTIYSNITVREPPKDNGTIIEENGDKHKEVPFLIIIICAVFLTVVIIGFVFITAKARYTIMEKEKKAREEEERIRIEAVTQSYEAENARVMAMASYRPPTVDYEDIEDDETFFGIKPSAGGPPADTAAIAPDQPGAPIMGSALPISGEPQLPPSPPPTTMPGSAPQLPPSPPPSTMPGSAAQPFQSTPPTAPPQPGALVSPVPMPGSLGAGQPPVAPPTLPQQAGPTGAVQTSQQQAGLRGPVQTPPSPPLPPTPP